MSFVPKLKCDGRLFGYARVSTPEQRLDLQIDCLSSTGCIQIFKDHGISGAKAKRPGLDAMLAALRRDDMVVVYKLDRLGRSVLHLSDLLVRFQREGIHFCSISEGINTATPAGQLTFHLFSAVSEFQRQIIAENTAAGLRAAQRRGIRLGRPRRLSDKQVRKAKRSITKNGRRREDVAKALGVSRMTLDRALQRLGASS